MKVCVMVYGGTAAQRHELVKLLQAQLLCNVVTDEEPFLNRMELDDQLRSVGDAAAMILQHDSCVIVNVQGSSKRDRFDVISHVGGLGQSVYVQKVALDPSNDLEQEHPIKQWAGQEELVYLTMYLADQVRYRLSAPELTRT